MPFIPNKNLVNKSLADRSHAGTSYDPEKRAEQEIEGFGGSVSSVYDELRKHAKTEAQQTFLDTEMARFQTGFAAKYNDLLAAKGRTISSFITGGSNFPTRRAEKANSAEDKRYEEMIEYRDRAQAAILRELKKMVVEEAGGEVEVLKAKIADTERNHEFMVKANAIIRKKIPDEQKIKEIQAIQPVSDKTVQELLKPDYMNRIGFPAWALSNDTANIKRMKDRVLELEKKEATPSADVAFEGGTMHDSKEDDRIQLFFDQKPPQAMIDKLKGEGWHWSPSIGAWQRKRTDNALFSARRILGLEQQNPVFVPVKEVPISTDADFEKAKLFLSSLAMARTLDELVGWQPAVKRWSIKFPELEKELESEYQARYDLLKAAKDLKEAERKEKASKPQSEQAKDLYKQMRKTNSVRELDDWRNRVLFEAHLPDVEDDILLRELAAKWRVYLETRGIPALEKLDKLPLDYKDEDYYFGTEVYVHPTTQILDDVPWKGIIHEARNGGELWEVARVGSEAEGTSRVPIDRIYVTKLVEKPEQRYQAPVKKIEDYKGVKYIIDKDNYVWVQESPYPKLDKHYTYLSEFKKHVDTLEKRKQEESVTVEWTPQQAIKLAADTVETLRKPDVFRVLSQNKAHAKELGAFIKSKRADLANEVENILFEFTLPTYKLYYWNLTHTPHLKEKWHIEYKVAEISDKGRREFTSFGSRYFETWGEIQKLLASGTAKLWVHDVRGDHTVTFKPVALELPRTLDKMGKSYINGKFITQLVQPSYTYPDGKWGWTVQHEMMENGRLQSAGREVLAESVIEKLPEFTDAMRTEAIIREALKQYDLSVPKDKVGRASFILDVFPREYVPMLAKLEPRVRQELEPKLMQLIQAAKDEENKPNLTTDELYAKLFPGWNLSSIHAQSQVPEKDFIYFISTELKIPEGQAAILTPALKQKIENEWSAVKKTERDNREVQKANEDRERLKNITALWNEVKDLKITGIDVKIDVNRDKPTRTYYHEYINIYMVLENGKKVKVHEEINKERPSKPNDPIYNQMFGRDTGEPLSKVIGFDKFVTYNRYEDYQAQKLKPKFTFLPEEQPAVQEKPKFVIENPFGVDLSKSIVPYPALSPVVQPKTPKIVIDTSSKDYKAGYNLAIQGRIAPAVPAWTDQGKVDFAQGYKDGQLARSKPKNLTCYKCGEKFQRIIDIEQKTIACPKCHEQIEILKAEKLDTDLEAGQRLTLAHREKREESKETPVFGLPQDTKKVIEEFGKPVQATPEKPRFIGAPSRQEQTERELRAKAQEGKKFRGQVTLFGAVSTSRRLGEFEAQDGFVYHGTTEGRAREIAIEGLKGGYVSQGEQGKYIYFSTDEQYAKTYAERKGGSAGVVLRTKRTARMEIDPRIIQKGKNIDLRTLETINPNEIDIKTSSGWQKLVGFYKEKPKPPVWKPPPPIPEKQLLSRMKVPYKPLRQPTPRLYAMSEEQENIEEEREAMELARATVGRITEQKLKMQIEREKRAE